MFTKLRGVALGVAVVGGLLAGCSEGIKASEFTITATEYKFEATGAAVPGSNLVTFKNNGKEVHQVQLVQLAPGKTLPDLMAVLATGDLSKVPGRFEGGVGQLAAGGSGQLEAGLTNGTYAMLCFVPGADGAPHFVKGMASTFEVTGQQNQAVFSKPAVKVVATDYAFEAPAKTKAGPVAIELTNSGKEPHEANLFKLASGVTVEQATKALAATGAPPAGPPPFVPAGGAQGVLPGQKTQVIATLEKGEYMLICFIPDPTGTEHFAKGMVRALTVE
jgi:uncharacterized cupredoxin-like copper-binding protein